MSFFDSLQQQTASSRDHVLEAPVFEAVRQGRFDRDSYTWFLTQAYHHVKHTVPLMMACGGRLRQDQEWIRKALVHYIDDEYGHEQWILDDLAACGADRDAAMHSTPDRNIQLMVAWLYHQIERGNPLAFFGMVHVLEGTSIAVATQTGQVVQKTLGLPKKAFSYLFSHGALDLEHFEFFRTLMEKITDPEDQRAIVDSADMVYHLYGNMLHNIPLLAEGGKHHAVA
ncbi:MAG: iron-containing redox enzyme family protein [Alcanivoracaceae bacterium]|jgi:pyrroloquinoline quinone (PQQ) biosynthesis protein C|nr:iron-containing redox enzyme family protein [Alcanivoracaceae bacterium]